MSLSIRNLLLTIVTSTAAAAMVVAAVPAAAATTSNSTTTSASAASAPKYRQYLGTVSAPTYLEASVPSAGLYLLQYRITGTAYFDSYVDGVELGYVGGPSGRYNTKAVQLNAGGHLIQVVGPEGSGTARVYIVSAH